MKTFSAELSAELWVHLCELVCVRVAWFRNISGHIWYPRCYGLCQLFRVLLELLLTLGPFPMYVVKLKACCLQYELCSGFSLAFGSLQPFRVSIQSIRFAYLL